MKANNRLKKIQKVSKRKFSQNKPFTNISPMNLFYKLIIDAIRPAVMQASIIGNLIHLFSLTDLGENFSSLSFFISTSTSIKVLYESLAVKSFFSLYRFKFS